MSSLRSERVRGASRGDPDDAGFSLIVVIGVAFVAMALMIVSTAVATRSLTSSREHSHFEGAMSAAENGIDQALARAQTVYNLTGTDSYVSPSTGITGDPSPDCNAAAVSWSGYPMPAQPTEAQEKAFARSVLNSLPNSCVRVTNQGDYAFFKPSGRQTIYAMGWYPHKDAHDAKSRLVKAEYLFVPYRPQAAILTSGPVALGSSTTVTSAPPNDPALAGVHSNDTVTVSTGNPTVYGKVSSSNPSTASSNNFYANTATGGAVEQMARMRIPAISAAAVWANNRSSGPPGGWYDLCSDGKVRAPTGSVPCAGTELADVSGGGEFRGWSYDGSASVKRWIAGSGLKQNGYSGTYYVNGADVVNNASNSGSAVPNLTVIVAAVSPTCNKTGGNLTWSHSDIAAPSVPNLFFLAEQDLLTTSNFTAGSASGGTVVSGMFIAGDQMQMETSSTGAYGSVITGDQCDPPDGTSLVDSSIIKNPSIYYDPNAQAPFVDIINTTLWLEYVG